LAVQESVVLEEFIEKTYGMDLSYAYINIYTEQSKESAMKGSYLWQR
jgi:ribosomal protein S24E